nr:hypothetical protein CFP56_57819 [Quercus suber]
MADVQRLKRKRAKACHDSTNSNNSNNEDDSDESKKRGRPRVENQDESAADRQLLIALQRRRTQIRMAQRAYRQRKESTLDDLRKRVTNITGAVEAANKAFEHCRGYLAASGLSAAQLDELQKVSQYFRHLTSIVHNEQVVSPTASTILTPPGSSKSHDGDDLQTMDANVPESFNQVTPTHTTHELELVPSNTNCSGLPSDATAVGIETEASRYAQAPGPDMALCTHPPSNGAYRSSTPESIGIPHSLTPPRSYSFHETSFARRLHRAGLEAGFHLLLNRTRRPKCYERVFQLSLLGRSREKLIASLKSVLDRGPQDSLDFWEAPLIHIGGAGTHYQRGSQFGVVQPKSPSYHIGLIGPQTLATLENAARDNLSTEMTVDIAGFEGEWLDPYDVAGYLEEKGIYLDPWSTVAQAEVTEWPASPAVVSKMFSPDQPPPKFSTQDRSSAFDIAQLQILAGLNADFSKWSDLSPVTITGVGHVPAANDSWMISTESQFNASAPHDVLHGHAQIWNETGMHGTVRDHSDITSMPRMPMDPVHPFPLHEPRRKLVCIDVMKFIRSK